MKPIVIYADRDKNNKILLTKEEFEAYLKQAYDSGYSDGYASGKSNNWWNTPITYPTTSPITWTTPSNPQRDYTTITCDAHNDIGE